MVAAFYSFHVTQKGGWSSRDAQRLHLTGTHHLQEVWWSSPAKDVVEKLFCLWRNYTEDTSVQDPFLSNKKLLLLFIPNAGTGIQRADLAHLPTNEEQDLWEVYFSVLPMLPIITHVSIRETFSIPAVQHLHHWHYPTVHANSPAARNSLAQSCSTVQFLHTPFTWGCPGSVTQPRAQSLHNIRTVLHNIQNHAVKSSQPWPVRCCTVSSFCYPQLTFFLSTVLLFCIYFLHTPFMYAQLQ